MLNVVQILSRDILERNLATFARVWNDNNGKFAGSTECWLSDAYHGGYRDTGIAGYHKTADEFRFALQPAFTVQVPQVPKSWISFQTDE